MTYLCIVYSTHLSWPFYITWIFTAYTIEDNIKKIGDRKFRNKNQAKLSDILEHIIMFNSINCV
jgi:hypothetical protein